MSYRILYLKYRWLFRKSTAFICWTNSSAYVCNCQRIMLTLDLRQMILLEEFDGLTSAVDCKGDDGMLSLTFKSPDAFNYAMKTWSFVNQKNESKFLVIANHAGCGPDDQRQPY